MPGAWPLQRTPSRGGCRGACHCMPWTITAFPESLAPSLHCEARQNSLYSILAWGCLARKRAGRTSRFPG